MKTKVFSLSNRCSVDTPSSFLITTTADDFHHLLFSPTPVLATAILSHHHHLLSPFSLPAVSYSHHFPLPTSRATSVFRLARVLIRVQCNQLQFPRPPSLLLVRGIDLICSVHYSRCENQGFGLKRHVIEFLDKGIVGLLPLVLLLELAEGSHFGIVLLGRSLTLVGNGELKVSPQKSDDEKRVS